MCDPMSIAIAGTALSVAGAAKQAQEQNKYADRITSAQTLASNAERTRQQGYQKQNEAYATDAQAGFTRPAQDQALADATQKRSDAATSAISSTTPYEASSTAPNIVNETMAKSISDALARGKSDTQNLAALSSYGDLGLNNKIALNNSGQKIATTSGFAAGSNALLPFELQAASAGAKRPSILPGVVSMLGQGLSLYGAGGGQFGLNGPPLSVTTGPGAVTAGTGGLY